MLSFLYFSLVILSSLKTCELQKCNVLFIVVDDLRPALGAYNDKNAFTPNIDKLANNSFVFTNAFAQQALCAPSRNSFLTSRRPDSLHLYDFYSYWRDAVGNFTTLPQHFRNHGYFTKSIGKVFHPGVSSNFTDDVLYSWSDIPFHPSTEKYKEAKVCPTKEGTFARNLICPVIIQEQPEETLPDLQSLNAALHFLNNEKTNQPYFLAVGFHKPHIPLKFPISYLKYHPLDNITLPKNRWRPVSLPDVAWNPWTDVRSHDDIQALNITFPFGEIPDDIIRKMIQSYASATTYIDDLIGALLEVIDNNTVVVLLGDHGWSLGEHGEFAKYSNFDIATRVPLIIHKPGTNRESVFIDDLVELVDLFPTLVDLTEISDSLKLCKKNGKNSKLCTEGQSLMPLIDSYLNDTEHVGKKAIFTQYPRPGPFPTWNPNSDKPHLKDIKVMGYSIRTKTNKYTEWIGFNHTNFEPNWEETYGRELYDLSTDPNEDLNLVTRSDLEPLIKHLRKQLILGWRYV